MMPVAMGVFTVFIGTLSPMHPNLKRVRDTWPVPPTIVTDADCINVSFQFNSATVAYRSMPNVVIRSDLCRLMVLCAVGGTYVDADVEYLQNFTSIVHGVDLLVTADGPDPHGLMHASNHFMHATRGQRCMCSAMSDATNRVLSLRGRLDFERFPHLVHNTAGPRLVHEHVSQCLPPPYRMYDKWIKHHAASSKWAGTDGYFSWTKDRMRAAGWKTTFEH